MTNPNRMVEHSLDKRALRLSVPVLLCAALVVASSVPTQARPAYALRTGLPCGQCHINPAGGGPRTAFGKAFAANGHRVPGTRYGRRRGYGNGYHGGGITATA
jgi:hypothetical protein